MPPRKINYLIPFFLLFLLFACSNPTDHLPERPSALWVFRSVLDEQPRMLTALLHQDLNVAYSAQTGSLYKAWRGEVELDGAVYTTAHGPQPESIGKGWTENTIDEPWRIVRGDKTYVPDIQYRGHQIKDGQLFLRSELTVPELSLTLMVSENPEYLGGIDGQTGLERNFTVSGLPENTQLRLLLDLASLPTEKSLVTNGKWELEARENRTQKEINSVRLTGALELLPNEATHLKTFFVKRPLLANANTDASGQPTEDIRPEGEQIIERSGCKTCHNTYVRTVGPAYKAVAERYANTEENIAMLVSKVVNGGAGKWGQAAMTAHDNIPVPDIRKMVRYIMDLDKDTEVALVASTEDLSQFETEESQAVSSSNALADEQLKRGIRVKCWKDIPDNIRSVNDVNWSAQPSFEAVVPQIDLQGNQWGLLEDYFAASFSGYLKIPETSNYLFRVRSDDGSRLLIDGQEVILHDGLHGPSPMDGELALKAGNHPFRLDFFEMAGGQAIRLEWRSFFSPEWEVIPADVFAFDKEEKIGDYGPNLLQQFTLPGDGQRLSGVHPSYTLSQARPNGFAPKVGGMDFLSDGRLVISTWDAEGAVYLLDGVATGDPSKITTKKIATGLAEPLGLKVVEDTIYVAQKQEITKLIDHDGDDVIDEYFTLSNDWGVSANFHEFTFGLEYQEPYLYATLAIAILPGGASANPQIPDRGRLARINRYTGETDLIASGLRTPNGVGIGVDDQLFIADNQGDWLPSCKILHVKEGAFFNNYSVTPDETKVPQPPVVWLPQDEIGNSPTTPTFINNGPYAGQMIHGEITHGGIKRVFVEQVAGEYQGAVFRFIQGLEAGVNRIKWGPDGALYVGMVGSTGNWGDAGKLYYGLQRLAYNEQPTFEMLAVRAKTNGVEIEFTEALHTDFSGQENDITVKQWYYEPTADYGGPKLGETDLTPTSVHVSEDRKKIFLELPGMRENHVIYLRLPNTWTSQDERPIWSTEAWYTMNQIPENQPGFRRPMSAPKANSLSDAERAAGWSLLFNGKNLEGWHTYGRTETGPAWKVNDAGEIYLDVSLKGDNWQVDKDLVTDQAFDNYELKLEWKIGACGNSGIIYNVTETPDLGYPWMTGPEMQILDNSCHPDAELESHRAGALYDMLPLSLNTVKPAGEWNRVRLVVTDGLVEHWLNGRKVVSYPNRGKAWEDFIEASKFKGSKTFGKSTSGQISLQDHGDAVWFRNIKIRSLNQDS
ncbi:MAG: family 16 glycoside hydrolase [Bacteroidota bacterium]